MIVRGVPDLHPDSSYFYELDWAPVMASGVAIESYEWTVPSGLTQEAISLSGTRTGVKLSVDTAEIGMLFDVTCKVVTNTGLTLNQMIRVRVGLDGY